MLQHIITAALVLAAFAYSAWALMPAAWRHSLRRRLGLAAPTAGSGCSGCGEGGCGAPARPATSATATITLHRRTPGPASKPPPASTPAAATPRPDESAGAAAP